MQLLIEGRILNLNEKIPLPLTKQLTHIEG